MAGIGFRLQLLLNEETTGSQLKALFYSAIIATGPWLISVTCIALIGLLTPAGLGQQAVEAFRVTVTYAYACSIITVGMGYMVVTRHIADRLFAGDEGALAPAFFTSALMVVGVQAVLGGVAAFFLEGPFAYRVTTVALYIIISLIWHAMIFLSAARDYDAIVRAFFVGSAVCVGASWALGSLTGWVGYLVGFTLGQGVIWALLCCRVLIEFDAAHVWDGSVPTAFRSYRELFWIGLFYNLGIWIDKFVFWFGPEGRPVMFPLWTYSPYDSALFLAYLTVVPASTLFLIKVETGFYDAYRDFYGAIERRASLPQIRARQEELGATLTGGLGAVIKIQGAISATCLLFSDVIIDVVGLAPSATGMFRVGILGAFLHSLFLIALVMIMYFDLRRLALRLSLMFCLLNFGLTLATQSLGHAWYGYGYAVAALISFGLAYLFLAQQVNRLIYLTFAGQPVVVPAVESAAE